MQLKKVFLQQFINLLYSYSFNIISCWSQRNRFSEIRWKNLHLFWVVFALMYTNIRIHYIYRIRIIWILFWMRNRKRQTHRRTPISIQMVPKCKEQKKIENYWLGSILRCKNERHGEKSAEKMAFILWINRNAYAR